MTGRIIIIAVVQGVAILRVRELTVKRESAETKVTTDQSRARSAGAVGEEWQMCVRLAVAGQRRRGGADASEGGGSAWTGHGVGAPDSHRPPSSPSHSLLQPLL